MDASSQEKASQRHRKNRFGRPDYISSEDSFYYYKDDIKRLMEFTSDSAAYRLIQNLNKELKAQGYITKCGAVPKEYFHQRYYSKK